MKRRVPLCCPRCNGHHKGEDQGAGCPKRLKIEGRYYRVLPTAEFAKRRRQAFRMWDAEKECADLDNVYIYSPYNPKGNQLLDISATPYIGRYFVERIAQTPSGGNR